MYSYDWAHLALHVGQLAQQCLERLCKSQKHTHRDKSAIGLYHGVIVAQKLLAKIRRLFDGILHVSATPTSYMTIIGSYLFEKPRPRTLASREHDNGGGGASSDGDEVGDHPEQRRVARRPAVAHHVVAHPAALARLCTAGIRQALRLGGE